MREQPFCLVCAIRVDRTAHDGRLFLWDTESCGLVGLCEDGACKRFYLDVHVSLSACMCVAPLPPMSPRRAATHAVGIMLLHTAQCAARACGGGCAERARDQQRVAARVVRTTLSSACTALAGARPKRSLGAASKSI